MRPSRIQTYMECAQTFAKRATCHRLNVGAVIVKDRTIVAHGYNGPPSGEPHCSGNDCPGRLECKRTIHAEENAIKRLEGTGCGWGWDIYCTDSPCPSCASMIIRYGGQRVFFATPYRITDSLDFLIEQKIKVYRVTPAGYVIDWAIKDVVDVEV